MLDPDPPLTVGIDDAEIPDALSASAVDRLALPLLALGHDGRLRVVASAALWRIGPRLALTTAAHLFETGIPVGDLGVAAPGGNQVWWFWAHGARLTVHREADLALIQFARSDDFPDRWRALPPGLLDVEQAAGDAFVMAGWPSEQTLWTGGRLVARPVVCLTQADPSAQHTYRYRRVADRPDGVAVHTPALEGASGALLWRLAQHDDHCVLQPAGMQVSFVHGRFLRCTPRERIAELLHGASERR